MTRAKRKKLPIDGTLFSMAFNRDADFEDLYDSCPQSAYLDKETGDIHWLYENEEDAESEGEISLAEDKALRRQIANAPDRFLEIPGRDHGEHHELLREFLRSEWTDNESLREETQAAYSGSIGRWKHTVDDEEIVYAYHDFRDRRLREMAEDFLKKHDIEPEWK